MPIFRYFVFVGGALLALLFAVNYVAPASPVARAVTTASNDQPPIRIRSDRHLPERVVLDTSQPAIAAPVVKTAAVAPQPPDTASAAALAETSARARVRETFAQFTPNVKTETATARKGEVKPQVQQAQAQTPQSAPVPAQPKRKVARAHPAPQYGGPQYGQFGRPMMVAQRPQFGFFNSTW